MEATPRTKRKGRNPISIKAYMLGIVSTKATTQRTMIKAKATTPPASLKRPKLAGANYRCFLMDINS
jgi:hypothetical protein